MSWKWKLAQAIEIKWWKQYLKKQPPMTYLQSKKEYWHRVLKKLSIGFDPNDRILEAGCGPAGTFIILDGLAVDAIDPLIHSYQKQLDHFDPDWYPNVNFAAASIEKWTSNKIYDKVLCFNAINHVNDIQFALNKLAKWTAQNGELVITIDSHKYSVMKWLFKWVPLDILHPHQFTLADYQNLVQQQGMKIDRTVNLKTGYIFDYFAIIAIKE